MKQDSGKLMMEHEAFAGLLIRCTVTSKDGSVLFKMYNLDLPKPNTTPEGLIIVHKGVVTSNLIVSRTRQQLLEVMGS